MADSDGRCGRGSGALGSIRAVVEGGKVTMGAREEELDRELRSDLRHRWRPMTGRDPDDRSRSTTPLELLYDLVYVIAFGAAAEQLAEHLTEGDVGSGLGAYVFAVFAVTWAWLNFTWFTSAYGTDDVPFRLATIVQMVGVVVLVFGLPASFAAAAEGHSPQNWTLVAGYIVMRVPQIALWLRAARDDPERRVTDVAYAVAIGGAQIGWIVTALVPLPTWLTVGLLGLLALAEMTAPVLIESRAGRPPWNAGHLAERFNLLTLICIGEVVAATTTAVGAVVADQGWTVAAVVVVASGIVLASALWWAYFLIPSRALLVRWPERTMTWRYAHLPLFAAVAAVGAGLRVAADAVERPTVSLLVVTLCLAVPVACVLVTVFVTWSVLTRAHDLSHVPLFAATLVPLAIAVAVAANAGDEALDTENPANLTALVVVMALVALAAVIEVVGHELVGYRHTLRAVSSSAPREFDKTR